MEAAAAPTPAAPPSADAAAPSASTPSAVHPAARWLARLFSPMSLKDQASCADRFQRLLWGSLFLSFPVAYWLGNVLITMGAVVAATVVCLVLFVPNWYQHPDPALHYADDTAVYYYYQQYEAAKKKAKEPQTTTTTAAAAVVSDAAAARTATPVAKKKA